MPTVSLIAWLLIRSTILPHEPATLSVAKRADLPASDSVYGLIETTIAQITSDRFSTSDLSVATPARISAYGSSWTATTFVLDDIDLTSPLRPGTPFLIPDTAGLDAVDVTPGPWGVSGSGAGARISLVPARPGASRALSLSAMGSPPGWTASRASGPPPLISLHGASDLAAAGSAPIPSISANLFGSVHWTRASQVTGETASTNSLFSATGHLVITPSRRPRDEFRALVMAQRAAHTPERALVPGGQPALIDAGALAAVTWQRRDPKKIGWQLTAAFLHSGVASQHPGQGPIVFDSAASSLWPVLFDPSGGANRLQFAAQITPRASPAGRHDWRAGLSLSQSWLSARMLTSTRVTETVAGLPARVWDMDPGGSSHWRQTQAALFADDRLTLGRRVRVEGGVRLESLAASNTGAVAVHWRDLYPSVVVDAVLSARLGLHGFAGFQRAGGPLPPGALAWGDPNGPTGRVSRWIDANANGVAEESEATAAIARIGPGAGAGLSSIDPALVRPRLTQGVLGVRIERGDWAVSVAAVLRRESRVVQPVDTGVPFSSYTPVGIADTGVTYPGPATETLYGFSRSDSSFGQDVYRLTNPADLATRFEGLDLGAAYRSSRVQFVFSATASRGRATAALRGADAIENDPAVIGDVALNPNAEVNARGRSFFDRGYNGKLAAVLRLPAATRLGVAVRYQDGQPFARLAVVPGLSQGPEAVTAYASGLTRFTFIATIDLRLQKTLRVAGRDAALILDIFNLINEAREVEETVATGPSFRVTSAVQPPRVLRIGLRVSF